MKETYTPSDVRHTLNATFVTFLLRENALPVTSNLYQDLATNNESELDWHYGELKREMHTIFDANSGKIG